MRPRSLSPLADLPVPSRAMTDHALAILGGILGGAVVAYFALFRPPRVH